MGNPMNSFLPVSLAFISIGSQHEPGNPRRCPAHLFADVLDAGVLFCFQNDLVVHVPDDPLLPQRLHGVGQNVAADGLRDVFHQLRTVALDPLKLFLSGHAIVGDPFAAKLVLADPRYRISVTRTLSMNLYEKKGLSQKSAPK